ncbi:MAG: VWA domain-containing protein [Bacteroidetes bacterium]|nr:VWA domain-containing protein [Bacteroidota bacterium]MBU1116466.1 VWA domain-containing protein [Bacteroidota bacterium]MBU1797299.1 VWA domain-containing protein [Bacteroidota bacterium]
MKTKNYIGYFTLLMLIILSFQNIFATGVLYVRPRFSTQQYEKMWIKSIDVDVNIQDQIAVTKVDQIFYNEMDQSVEAIYLFPLPENAMMTKLVYWFNGERYEAEIRERQDAINAYNQKLNQWLDPALLEYMGDNLFRLSIVPVNANTEVRTEMTYVEMLNYDFGINNYKYLLNTLDLSSQPLETVHFFMNAQSQNPFKYFNSPSHNNPSSTQLIKLSDYNYTLEFGDENFYPDKDLIVKFETVRDEVQFSVLTYSPTEEDSMGTDSFYSLWITPPDSITDDETIPKDIVFTADVSSSMGGMRIAQVKQSLDYYLNLLNPADQFNIVTFGTYVAQFKPDLIPATAENIEAAHNYVFQMYALGMTNISAALDSSLTQSFGDTTSNNLIFLTDGKPTVGITDAEIIINNAAETNTKNVKIFSFGVGDNLNRNLITKLANENHGYATYITSDDSIAILVNNHFTKISKPLITDLQIDFGGLQSWDRYPKVFSDLYWGSQSVEMGLYTNSGSFPITLTGKIGSESIEFTKTLNFSDSSGYRFVPRLWAKSKINHLLDLIDINGESDELIDQIIELSLRFQILTKYTAFYVDPEDDFTDIESNDLFPTEFTVEQNYPNPFNPTTYINYALPKGVDNYHVVIKIYDILGRLVKVLVDANQQPGSYKVQFDASGLGSGIYFYTVNAGQFSATKKMILMR